NGTVNTGPGTYLPTVPVNGPFITTSYGVQVNAGTILKVNALVGNMTTYIQQVEQMARVSRVPTAALDPKGTGPSTFVDNAPLPNLTTVVNGILDANQVNIADGSISGTGELTGSLNLYGPVAGYANPIEYKPDTHWNNLNNQIRTTKGGVLVAGG